MQELKQRAVQVKNETVTGANTAQRIGQLFEDIVDKVAENKAAIDSFQFVPVFDKGVPSGKIVFNQQEHTIYTPGDENLYMYGVEWDASSTNPDCVRIGNPDLHRTCPIQNAMRGCLILDDGTVTYLPENDWTESVRDGSQGQVMVEIPTHYRRCETDGNTLRVKLSLYPLVGYKEIRRQYVSAYQATVQRSTLKLASVVNTTADYYGGDNQPQFAGMAASKICLTDYRRYARNRNNGDTQWNCYTYTTHRDLTWLFVVEYATLNSQKDYDETLTAEGYKQGGLGMGVSEFNDWWSFNNGFPFIPNGTTDSLGNGTGIVEYEVKKNGATVYTAPVNRYHGIEMPFGHLYMWCDGLLTIWNDDTEEVDVYRCDDPAGYASEVTEAYKKIFSHEGFDCDALDEIYFGEDGDTIGTSANADYDEHYCDYGNLCGGSEESPYCLCVGGLADYDTGGGFFCAGTDCDCSFARSDYGSRLCYIPRNA